MNSMFALNFYSELYGDQLKSGRKSATIRLGDKSSKYATGQIVWVTTGQRYAHRKKLFCAILDKVEVKPLDKLSPRDIQRENPEFRTVEDVVKLLNNIYGEQVSPEQSVTIIYFSQVDEYEL
jgi:hypothetical protein